MEVSQMTISLVQY